MMAQRKDEWRAATRIDRKDRAISAKQNSTLVVHSGLARGLSIAWLGRRHRLQTMMQCSKHGKNIEYAGKEEYVQATRLFPPRLALQRDHAVIVHINEKIRTI